MIELDSFN